MKDILQIAFRGECKNATFTTRRGKHFFCAEPTDPEQTYCPDCTKQMYRPTVRWAVREIVRAGPRPESVRLVPVDEFCRKGEDA